VAGRIEPESARFVRIDMVEGRVEPFGAEIKACAFGRAFAPAARRALVATERDASSYNFAVIDVDTGEIILDHVARPDRNPGMFDRVIVEAELSSKGDRMLVWTRGLEPVPSDDHFELWDVERGVRIGELPSFEPATSMALSLDGRRAAIGAGRVAIYDLTKATDNLLERPTASVGEYLAMISGVSFSPDGAHVLSSRIEKVARFWTL
jgi:WD40 repeat protein